MPARLKRAEIGTLGLNPADAPIYGGVGFFRKRGLASRGLIALRVDCGRK